MIENLFIRRMLSHYNASQRDLFNSLCPQRSRTSQLFGRFRLVSTAASGVGVLPVITSQRLPAKYKKFQYEI